MQELDGVVENNFHGDSGAAYRYDLNDRGTQDSTSISYNVIPPLTDHTP